MNWKIKPGFIYDPRNDSWIKKACQNIESHDPEGCPECRHDWRILQRINKEIDDVIGDNQFHKWKEGK